MNTKLICMFCFILLISLATLPINNSSSNSDSALDSSRENDSQPLIDSIDRVPVTTFTQSSSTVELTWTSRDDDVRRIFVPPVASGDHVILHVDAYDQLIQTSLLDFTPSFSQTNILEIPSEGYNPYFDFDMSPDDGELSWFSFYGLQRGQLVTIVGLFSNSDCDFMAWTGGTDPMSYVDNIIGALMTTTSNPEGVCFEWDFNSQELIIACYNCDGETGWVELNVFVDSTADVVAAGNYIAYDTYEFQENVTVPLLYLGLTDGILMESVFHPALTFNNYFTPNITQFPPIGLGAKQFNFTWTCSDHNQDDVNYYSVWLSSDSGFTYQLLAGNLTDTFFVWDSTGFMIRENYLVKIRAYSLDFTYRDYCRVDNPPASYWPGDFSDSESFEIDAGDVHSIPPGYYEILFDSPDDVSYNEQSDGNIIVWRPTFAGIPPSYIDYDVLHNNTSWRTGRYYPYSNQTIEIDIDGLSPGTHEFKLRVGLRISDPVTVHVLRVEPLESPWSQLLHYGAIGVSIGSSFIILLVIVLSVRLRSEHISKLTEYSKMGFTFQVTNRSVRTG